jgi:hypothetical protein
MEQYKNNIIQIFKERDCIVITKEPNKSSHIEYICKCGEKKCKLYKDFVRRGCRTCNSLKLKQQPDSLEYVEKSGEIWKPITGGWISSFGNAKNGHGKTLLLCPTKLRFRMNGKNQYASRLVACAFKIQDYEKLNDNKFVVSHIDGNSKNNNVNNLKVISKSIACMFNGNKYGTSSTFIEKSSWIETRFSNLEYKIIQEFPSHKIYSNGEIWNGNRFLTFSRSGKYLNLVKPPFTYKLHRLICYAFHPIENKNHLEDYDNLQVNHKNGNTLDNSKDNLEWISSSDNLFHAYSTGLNKKQQGIIQLDMKNKYINSFLSIAEASRQTGEPEHRIREIAKGNKNSKAKYIWKFIDENKAKEYSAKFSSRTEDNYYYIYKNNHIIGIPFNPSILSFPNEVPN